jgi:CDP-2,3-bis-(O-geranylgeranyl)-sn-glycerol synthase
MLTLKLIFLLVLANGVPILLNKWLGRRYAWPIDGGMLFFDRRPLLGPSKTIRGFLGTVILTAFAAFILDFSIELGVLIGVSAMLGDLFSSFIKRRLKIPSSDMAIGLDQVPEALFPLLAIRSELELDSLYIICIALSFLLLELAISRILYDLHIRERPY